MPVQLLSGNARLIAPLNGFTLHSAFACTSEKHPNHSASNPLPCVLRQKIYFPVFGSLSFAPHLFHLFFPLFLSRFGTELTRKCKRAFATGDIGGTNSRFVLFEVSKSTKLVVLFNSLLLISISPHTPFERGGCSTLYGPGVSTQRLCLAAYGCWKQLLSRPLLSLF